MSCFGLNFCGLLLFFNVGYGQISGVINNYAKVTSINTTCNFITVSSTIGFNKGDKAILMQMKGASIDAAGNVTNYNSAGNYEVIEIDDIQINDIYSKTTFLNSYDPLSLVQIVNVPMFTNVSVTGTLTAKPWDGNTGGILALEVSDTLKLNANINVSGLGFRGGKPNLNGGSGCSSSINYTNNANVDAAGKGESIYIPLATQENGRARIANGGGGGLAQNTGGGGGANIGSGGNGGNQSSGCSSFFPSYPGIGGAGLLVSNANNKIFLGGGGGAGQQNNLTGAGPPSQPGSTPGGNGGGLAFIKANNIITNGFQIVSTGLIPATSPAYGDGAGGGGAGGSVLLDVNNIIGSLVINVTGSKGDNVFNDNFRNIGPGGGGGGGFIGLARPTISPNINTVLNGGVSGIVYGFATNCNCNHNATAGAVGAVLTNFVTPKSTINSACALPVNLLSFKLIEDNNKIRLEWKVTDESEIASYLIIKSTNNSKLDTVANIKAFNNKQLQDYLYVDNYISFNEMVKYQIYQIETNGKSTLLTSKEHSFYSEIPYFLISPNPFNEVVEIKYNLDSQYYILISDQTGRSVYTNSLTGYTNEIDLRKLNVGVYSVQILTDQQNLFYKLIKN